MNSTPDLFDDLPPSPTAGPAGFRYAPAIISGRQQDEAIRHFSALPFQPFDFHGFKGNRETVSFGSRYDFSRGGLAAADPMPDWLSPLRRHAALFADIGEDELSQVLVTRYAPGAGIGWHRDRPEYGRVVGLSFATPCAMRFRRREDDRWIRLAAPLEPGSAYLLDGPARTDWQHSILPQADLRYSVTFRTLPR